MVSSSPRASAHSWELALGSGRDPCSEEKPRLLDNRGKQEKEMTVRSISLPALRGILPDEQLGRHNSASNGRK